MPQADRVDSSAAWKLYPVLMIHLLFNQPAIDIFSIAFKIAGKSLTGVGECQKGILSR
jgi:hypothetical protein